MTRSEIIEQLKNEYRQQRTRNEQEQDARTAQVEAVDPQIRVLWAKQTRLLTDAVRAFAHHASNAKEMAERMRIEGAVILREIEERTVKAGFPADYMQITYRCPACQDKGVLETGGFCDCFHRAINERMGSEARTIDSFESFREDFAPDELVREVDKTQRQYLNAARDYLKRFADTFPNVQKRMILLYGPTGLGKSFLLNCVVRRVIERGGDVMRVTSYRMFEAMREKHMTGSSELFDQLLGCQLLAIDDLGSEPMMRNITVEYLFMLLNERTNTPSVATILATNLTPLDLRERYGERIASRLLDKETGAHIRFAGKDLRTKNG